MDYDLAVIGAGPGGYTAALRASQLGLKTVCIDEREQPGGTCLNVGCIPSKALLETTGHLQFMKHQGPILGFDSSSLTLSFPKMMQHKEQVVKSLTDGIKGLFKNGNVEYVVGKAKLVSPNEVEVGSNRISAKWILIATGSATISLPFLQIDEKKVLSSTGALDLQAPPKSLLVIGAGVIGVELGSVYARLGTKVQFIEMLSHICGNLDATLHNHYLRLLKAQGMAFDLEAKVVNAEIGEEVAITVEKAGKRINYSAECLLLAIGRKPYSAGLGLEELGVQLLNNGMVQIDELYRTSIPSIYAIGDLVEGPMLAHKASEEGIAAVEAMVGQGKPLDYMLIPNIIYTHPEIATLGFTEEEARATGREICIGTAYLKGNGRARAAAETDGLIKVIGDKKSGRVMGIHLMMPHASEFIAFGVMAFKARATLQELADLPFGHPTLSEVMKEACLQSIM